MKASVTKIVRFEAIMEQNDVESVEIGKMKLITKTLLRFFVKI